MSKLDAVLPVQHTLENTPSPRRHSSGIVSVVVGLCLLGAYSALNRYSDVVHHCWGRKAGDVGPFYSNVSTHDDLCPGGVSHSGYIGLKGDREGAPKRSFFWYFEAQENSEDAPVILTFGGGPGSSGMMNPMWGQSHCVVTENRTAVRNPNAWTEKYNLVALDHPVGSGYSYGTMVNNSRDAAYDVYDFLNKFFVLYPHLAKNKLIVASGSYGGTYIPHVATVIHEQNLAIGRGKGFPGARHINLESLMVSNPVSDYLSWWRWMLHQRCYLTDFYNATLCQQGYEHLPACLEATHVAYTWNTVENRHKAMDACYDKVLPPVTLSRSNENIYVKCNGTLEDCHPQVLWVQDFMNLEKTKRKLGVPEGLKWEFSSDPVYEQFIATADIVGEPYKLYEPLLRAGIRLLHYVGKADANCAWPGVLSTLKLIPSQHRDAFIAAPDVHWPGHNATVRVVGPGAGDFTYVLMDWAGHFVTKDEPELVKDVITHWVDNVPFI